MTERPPTRRARLAPAAAEVTEQRPDGAPSVNGRAYAEFVTEYETLSSMIRINKNLLDDELEVQSETFLKVTRLQGLVLSYRDGAKKDREREEARIDLQIRQEAAQANEKINEGGIRAKVILHQDVQQAADDHGLWESLYILVTGLKESFNQRSYAIKDLSGLWIAGYWTAGSTGDPNGRSRREVESDRVRQTHAEARERRAREARD